MKLLTLAIALACCPLPARALPTANKLIQPGARILRPDLTEPLPGAVPYKFYRCTLNFIFTDGTSLYTGTTGEPACATLGGRVVGEDGLEFGTTVFQEYSSIDASFSLIKIDQSRDREVDPSVRFWGGPTGVATAAEPNDIVEFTGNGEVEGDTVPSRAGALVSFDTEHFTANTLAELGDSGAPVIDQATGAAIGMISDFGFTDSPPTTDDGPTVARILRDLRANGFDLTLVTA